MSYFFKSSINEAIEYLYLFVLSSIIEELSFYN